MNNAGVNYAIRSTPKRWVSQSARSWRPGGSFNTRGSRGVVARAQRHVPQDMAQAFTSIAISMYPR